LLRPLGAASNAIADGVVQVARVGRGDRAIIALGACSALAYVLCVKGDLPSAIPRLEQARQLAREWEIPILSAYPTALLGYISVRSGTVEHGFSRRSPPS
jgi:hypothetical protein